MSKLIPCHGNNCNKREAWPSVRSLAHGKIRRIIHKRAQMPC